MIGIRAEGRWTGERLKQDGQETFRIEQCDSPLHMRMVLQDDHGAAITVLITSLEERELGGGYPGASCQASAVPLDSWQIVKLLFQARAIDPRVTQHGWMAECLLEAIPADGFPLRPADFLMLRPSGRMLLDQHIGFVSARPDLLSHCSSGPSTLRASSASSHPAPFRQAATGVAHAAGWPCCRSRPPVSPPTNAPMRWPSVWLRGSCSMCGCETVRQGRWQARRTVSRGKTLDAGIIDRWHAAATEVVSLQLTDAQLKRRQLQRADEILREVQADTYASFPVAPHRLALINAWPDRHTALCSSAAWYPHVSRTIDSGTAGDSRS